jgi:hypothetical protein
VGEWAGGSVGVIQPAFSAILSTMPTRSDDPPRSQAQLAAEPTSSLTDSPASQRVLQTTDDQPLTQESFSAVLSSHQRAGRWEPADEIQVRAVLGEVTLDFTRAELPATGMIEIEAWSIGGEIKIIVPDGAEVELVGTPILGSIEQQVRKKEVRERLREWVTGEREEDLPAPPQPSEPPYFHIDCHAIMGSIKVMGR